MPAGQGFNAPPSINEIIYVSSFSASDPSGRVIAQAVAEYEAISGNSVTIIWNGEEAGQAANERLLAGAHIDLWDGNFEQNMGLNHEFMLELSQFYDTPRPLWGGQTMREVISPFLMELALDISEGEEAALLGIPFAPYSVSMVYNVGHFSSAGISSTPQTWDQFLSAVRMLSESGFVPLSSDMRPADAYGYMLARMMGHRFIEDLMGDASLWYHPAVFRTALAFEELGRYLSRYEARLYAGPRALENEQISMRLMRTSDIGELLATRYQDSSIQLSAFNFPRLNGSDLGRDPGEDAHAMMYGSQAFFIPKASSRADDVFDLISIILSPSFDQQLSVETMGIPFAGNIAWPHEISLLAAHFNQAPSRMPITMHSTDNLKTQADYYFRQLLMRRITARQFVGAMLSQENP